MFLDYCLRTVPVIISKHAALPEAVHPTYVLGDGLSGHVAALFAGRGVSLLLFLLQAHALRPPGPGAWHKGAWSLCAQNQRQWLPLPHPAQLQPRSMSSCSSMASSSCPTTLPTWVVLARLLEGPCSLLLLLVFCTTLGTDGGLCCCKPQEDPSLTQNWQKTVRVAVTGASGQIANHLLFMVSDTLECVR